MFLIINIVPTVILMLIVGYRRYLFQNDLLALKHKYIWDLILYSFCISFIGYSLLTSVTYYIFNVPVIQIDRTPIMIVYAVLFSPIFEELICRKFLLNKLNKYTDIKLSILISSVVFAVLHFNAAGFLGCTFLGIVWGYYYKKSGSIAVPIINHFLFNYIVILIQSIKG